MPLSLTLCGPAVVVADTDGRPVPLPTKGRALLAYLALEPGHHSRETLKSLLWGDSDDDKANASLRQALSQLREAVGDTLLTDRTSVALQDGFPTDVATFTRLADADDVSALDVDVPRCLAGISVRDAPRFEEWADRTRDTLLRRYRSALVSAARAAHARRDWHRTLDLGHRWQQLDPLSDDATHLVVEVLYLKGDRDAALAAYRRFRETRRRETGHEPGLALRELFSRVETAPTKQLTPARLEMVREQSLPPFDARLIGRSEEWNAMELARSESAAGRARVVLVEGEVGVGRTRLLDDFVRLAATRGETILRGRGFEAGLDVPYGPLLDVLRGALEAPGAAGTDATWLAEVLRLVPEMRRRFPSVPATTPLAPNERPLVHEGVAQLLLAAAEESPTAIALDDVQWFDADSCRLLHHLVRRLENAPILWCLTSSLGTAARDAPGTRLTRALGALPFATRLRLGPLTRDDVWQLIRSLGNVRSPEGGARLATRVHELTDGNVLYVIELLRTLFARRWLTVHPETGEWMTTEVGDDVLETGEMFPTVREGIAERIASLPDEEHALLLTIAAVGHGCHTSVLSYVHGISRLRAAHIGDALVERHLVTENDATYRCAHALIASVVLDSVGASRRREVHRMIALALTDAAASVHRAVDPGAVARHAEAGGELGMAHRHALLASEACVAQVAWEDALAWLDIAAACAETPEQGEVANRATAAVLDRAGWSTALTRTPGRTGTLSIGRDDVDLSGT
jgi:DNA-binding SARP family transcriptional activator